MQTPARQKGSTVLGADFTGFTIPKLKPSASKSSRSSGLISCQPTTAPASVRKSEPSAPAHQPLDTLTGSSSGPDTGAPAGDPRQPTNSEEASACSSAPYAADKMKMCPLRPLLPPGNGVSVRGNAAKAKLAAATASHKGASGTSEPNISAEVTQNDTAPQRQQEQEAALEEQEQIARDPTTESLTAVEANEAAGVEGAENAVETSTSPAKQSAPASGLRLGRHGHPIQPHMQSAVAEAPEPAQRTPAIRAPQSSRLEFPNGARAMPSLRGASVDATPAHPR